MQDPGWGGSWRALIPGAVRMGASARSMLSTLRLVFVAYVASVVLFGIVLFFAVSPGNDEASLSGIAVAVVVAAGLVGLVGARLLEKPLDCTDAQVLAAAYRTRFFLRVAGAEIGAFAGFVMAFVVHDAVAYLPGLALTMIGLWRAAPTAKHIEADQEALNAAGCPRSLLATLTVAPTPPGLEPRPPSSG